MTVSTTTTSSEKWRLGEAQGTVGKLRQFLLLSRVPRGQLIGKDRMFLLYSEVWLVILWVVMNNFQEYVVESEIERGNEEKDEKTGENQEEGGQIGCP